MKIFTPFFLPKKLRLLLLLLAITLLPSLKVSGQCNGIENTFYQTKKEAIPYYNFTTGRLEGNFEGVSIYKYDLVLGTTNPNSPNLFKRVSHLRLDTNPVTATVSGQNPSGSQSSAYSKDRRLLYVVTNSNFPAENSPKNTLTLSVYDPCQKDALGNPFAYIGKVKFNVLNNPPFQSMDNLFTLSNDRIGFIKFGKLVMAYLDRTPSKNNNYFSLPELRAVTTNPITLTGTQSDLEDATNCNDFAFYNGYLYGMFGNTDDNDSNAIKNKTTKLVQIDPENGAVIVRKVTFKIDNVASDLPTNTGLAYGAVWIEGNGNFFAANNSNGKIFKISNVSDPESKTMIIAFSSSKTSSNDGFGEPDFTPNIDPTPPDCQNNGTVQILNHEVGAKYIFDPLTPGNITVDAHGYILNLNFNTSYKVQRDFTTFKTGFSIPFTIEAKAVTPLPLVLTSSAACLPSTVGSIESTTSEIGVSYQLHKNSVALGTAKVGDTLPLTWSDVPVGNGYYVKSTKITTLLNGTQIPCTEDSNLVDIVPSTPPNPQASIIQHITCTTHEGIIKIDPYDANVIYVLKAYDAINHSYGAIQHFNSAIPGFDELNQGHYKLLATNTAKCAKEIDTPFEIIQDPSVPITPEIEHTDIDCNLGYGTIKVTSEPPSVSTYTYILKDVNKKGIDSTTTAKPLFTNLAAGKYSVSLKIGICSSPDIEVTIHTIADPVAEVEISKEINCENPNLGDISVTAPIGNYTYKYTTTNGTAPGPAQSSPLFRDLLPGEYYFIAIDESTKCISIPKHIILAPNVTPPTKPNLELTQPDCKVNGQIGGKIEVLNTGNFSYQLVGTAPAQSFPIQDSPIFDHLQLGKYVVSIIDKISKCVSVSSDEVTIQDPYPVNPIANITHLTDCVNENTGAILVNPESNRSYTLLYYNPTINTNYDYQDTRLDGQFNGLRAGDYLLTVTNTLTECTSSQNLTIEPFIDTPVINDVEITQPTCLTKGSIKINDIPYEYSFDDGVTFSTTNMANDLMPGAYYIRIKDANGCISDHKEIIIDDFPVIPLPPIVTPTQPDCDTNGILTVTVVDYDDQYSFDNGTTYQTENIKANLPLGTYLVRIKSSVDCISEPVSVTFTEPECPSISLVKTATFNDEDGDTFAKANETITYHFTITNTGNIPLTNITLSDLLPGIAIHSETGTLSLQPGESNSTFFSATYSVLQTDIIRRFVTNTATISAESTAGKVEGISTYTIPLDPGSACDINVYNVVSANDDGKNDLFEIGGLDCYPENSLQIYNRWGVLVFERNPYNNSDKAFKGFSEGRVTISSKEKLPTGTYFYILKYRDNDANWHNKSGYLYLSL